MNAGIHDPAAMSGDCGIFGRYLGSSGNRYLLVRQTDDQSAYLRFLGRFADSDVVWDCHFRTLAAARAPRNFIEIGEPGERGRPLAVGLSVTRIDRPAIEKMIIMIRNYKRLREGRHEYG